LPVLVEATVQAPLTALPEKADLGTVMIGQSVSKRVIVRATKSCRITGIEGQEEGITADTSDASAERHTVTIKWQPTKAGDLKRQLVIKTDLDKDASLTIPIEGSAVAP
jgi:hypothetical protein